MATLTLKNIPKPLHDRLREIAKLQGRSLNRQIISILEAATGAALLDPQDNLDRIRILRQRAQLGLTDDEIEKAISEGRP